MTTFTKTKLKKSGGQSNLDKYSVAAFKILKNNYKMTK